MHRSEICPKHPEIRLNHAESRKLLFQQSFENEREIGSLFKQNQKIH
jgi:hypothetical protein